MLGVTEFGPKNADFSPPPHTHVHTPIFEARAVMAISGSITFQGSSIMFHRRCIMEPTFQSQGPQRQIQQVKLYLAALAYFTETSL